MGNPPIDWHTYFQRQAESDVDALVARAFSGDLGGFAGLPCQVGTVAHIRFRLLLSGQLTPEADALLQPVLRAQLESGQRHSRIWLAPNPDPETLGQVWIAQAEAMERWTVFTSAFEQGQNLPHALTYAFEAYPYQPIWFQQETAREVWLTLLKNEQQAFVNGSHRRRIELVGTDHHWEGARFHSRGKQVQLSPTHMRLLDLLMTGETLSTAALIKAIFGKQTVSPENRSHLSRRLSELNQKLLTVWGLPSPGKRWIHRVLDASESGYRLLQPTQPA